MARNIMIQNKVKFDNHRPMSYPWKAFDPSSKCADLPTQFLRPGSIRKQTALASTPKSGALWLRYLIEGMTGVYTGDLYRVS